MSVFIAYFDYLGFKKFIENNDLSNQKKIMGRNFRDMKGALSLGKYKQAQFGVIADLSESIINCLNFSDTVIFWTNDDSKESLSEILKVSYNFTYATIDQFFPTRGALVYGEIVYVDHKNETISGGRYNINSVYGKGVVRAHDKANSQQWAGTVFDESFISRLVKQGYNVVDTIEPYAKLYKVPYKNGINFPDEYVMRLIQGELNTMAFDNMTKSIRENFACYNKPVDTTDVQEKIENTICFLKSFLPNDK